MSQISLECARILAVVREFVAAGVAKHVGMGLDPEFRANRRPFDHTGETRG